MQLQLLVQLSVHLSVQLSLMPGDYLFKSLVNRIRYLKTDKSVNFLIGWSKGGPFL